MLSFIEERHINASDEKVFNIIADINNYKHWNPWIIDASGSTQAGERLSVSANMNVGKPLPVKAQVYQHKMLSNQAPDLFHWCDVGWFTLFADGNRKRSITKLDDNSCHYRVELQVSGIAAGLAKLFFGEFMSNGLKAEADALKSYAEKNNH